MFTRAIEELMLMIQKMELRAAQPPELCWHQSSLATLVCQFSELFYNAAIQPSSSSF